MGTNYRELPIAKTVGDALRDLIRKRYRTNAAKQIATDWDLDPKTARNVVTQGHVSERTLTKAMRAEGWALLEALGAELTGETYHQYEERKLQALIKDAAHASEKLVLLRARREALDAVAADDAATLHRAPDEQLGLGAGDHRRRAGDASHRGSRPQT